MITELKFTNSNVLSREEYKVIRDFISDKALLIKKQECKVQSTKCKDGEMTGFSIGNYGSINIDGRNFYIAFSNTFHSVIYSNLLLKACAAFPDKFGTENADDVLMALYMATEQALPEIHEVYEGDLEGFKRFISKAHCYVVEHSESLNESKILRLDLFRQLNKHKEKPNKNEFTGGLFHCFKHFSINKINLSTGKGKKELERTENLIELAIRGFFFLNLTEGRKKGQLKSSLDLDEKHYFLFVFYTEENSKVTFIDHITYRTKK